MANAAVIDPGGGKTLNRNSTRARRICFDAHKHQSAWCNGKIVLTCHICKQEIDPVRQAWRADHIKRKAEGGKETGENLWPICLDCDVGEGKKAAKDTKAVAHGKRWKDKHYGIKQSKRPMAGSRRSKWKRTMKGKVVPR